MSLYIDAYDPPINFILYDKPNSDDVGLLATDVTLLERLNDYTYQPDIVAIKSTGNFERT